MKHESASATDLTSNHPAAVGQRIESAIETTTKYLREKPWIGVAAGVIFGAAVVALSKSHKPEPTNLEKLRDLLEESYAKLPSKKEAKSALNGLLSKLHIPV